MERRKKNYEVWTSLLEFIRSFSKYSQTKELNELSNEDIQSFARMYYLEYA